MISMNQRLIGLKWIYQNISEMLLRTSTKRNKKRQCDKDDNAWAHFVLLHQGSSSQCSALSVILMPHYKCGERQQLNCKFWDHLFKWCITTKLNPTDGHLGLYTNPAKVIQMISSLVDNQKFSEFGLAWNSHRHRSPKELKRSYQKLSVSAIAQPDLRQDSIAWEFQMKSTSVQIRLKHTRGDSSAIMEERGVETKERGAGECR